MLKEEDLERCWSGNKGILLHDVADLRFYRWNFFLLTDVWYNVLYMLFSWKLGFGEISTSIGKIDLTIVTKIFVFQEIYEALLYLATPYILVCSLIVNW